MLDCQQGKAGPVQRMKTPGQDQSCLVGRAEILLGRVIGYRMFLGLPYSYQYANSMWPLSREPFGNLPGASNSMGDEYCCY